jgi:hypothetical protein
MSKLSLITAIEVMEVSFARAGTALPLCRYVLAERDIAVRY